MNQLVENTTHFMLESGRVIRLDGRLTGAAGNDAYNDLVRRRHAHFAERRHLIDLAHQLERAALRLIGSQVASALLIQAGSVRTEYDTLCKAGY